MRIKELIFNSKSKYIAITFVTSAVGFLKSFILLKFFDLGDLGMLTLAQTLTNTVTLFQFGMITGGYRLYAYKSESVLKKINAAVLVFFVLLSVLLFIGGMIAWLFFNVGISLIYLVIFLAVAILSLYSNWVICKLLATKNISVVNRAQLWSNIIILLITLSAKWLGFYVVIASMLLLPIILIGISYYSVPTLIPQYSFTAFKKYSGKVISVGFIPYLTSALTMLNSQVSRWIITFSLGTVILGRVYLVTLFVTLVTIFPSALSNLFFPSVIEKYEKKQVIDLKGTLNNYFYVLSIYFILVVIFTLALINVVVRNFLEKHIESISLIYAILPSLLFIHLSNPAITLFNAAKKFRNILTGSILMVLSYSVLVALYLSFFKAKLVDFFIIESLSSFVFFAYNIYHLTKIKKIINYEKQHY